MKLGRCWRAGEEQAAGVIGELARAVRLAGASWSATAVGYKNAIGCGAIDLMAR